MYQNLHTGARDSGYMRTRPRETEEALVLGEMEKVYHHRPGRFGIRS